MATYLATQMTSMADIVRAKTGETGLLSVTSMISAILTAAGRMENGGVKPFLERNNHDNATNTDYYPNGVMPFPVQAASIGPYAFFNCKGYNSLMQARGIVYKQSVFSSCPISNNMLNHNVAGGVFSASYDPNPAPPREPSGGTGPDIDPSIVTNLLDPTRYTNITAHFEGLASTVRAVADVTDPLTLRSMVDLLNTADIGGTTYVLAKLIDRTITEIEVPAGVSRIGDCAFRGCTNLSYVSLPTTMVEDGLDGNGDAEIVPGGGDYGTMSFDNCHADFHLKLPGNVSFYRRMCHPDSRFYCTYTGYYNDSTYTYYSYYESWNNTIDEQYGTESTVLTYVKPYVVESPTGAEYLQASTLDFENVQYLESNTFNGNSHIESVNLTGVSVVHNNAFNSCINLSQITFGNNHTYLCDGVFKYTGFTSLTIPNTAEIIGKAVFQNCPNLKFLSIATTVNTNFAEEMIQNCSELTSVIITGGITNIGFECFDSDSSLKYVSLPNTVQRFGMYAFWHCSSLSSINWPTALQRIEYACFLNASHLSHVDLGNTNLKYIAEVAFEGCYYMSSCILPATVSKISAGAFNGCHELSAHPKAINVGSEYKTNDVWKVSYVGYYSRYTTGDTVNDGTQYYAWSRVAGGGAATIYYTTDAGTGITEGVGAAVFIKSDGDMVIPHNDDSSHVVESVFCSSIRCNFPSTVLFNTDGTFKHGECAPKRCFYFP